MGSDGSYGGLLMGYLDESTEENKYQIEFSFNENDENYGTYLFGLSEGKLEEAKVLAESILTAFGEIDSEIGVNRNHEVKITGEEGTLVWKSGEKKEKEVQNITINDSFDFLRKDIKSLVVGSTRKQEEIREKNQQLKILLEHILDEEPVLFEQMVKKTDPTFSIEDENTITIGYHAEGTYKNVFRVEVIKPGEKKISFIMALKTRFVDKDMLAEGELEAGLKLQGSNIVPQLHGLFHVGKTKSFYDKVVDGLELHKSGKRMEGEYVSLLIEEFIEGDTVRERVSAYEPIPISIAGKSLSVLIEVFLRINDNKAEIEAFVRFIEDADADLVQLKNLNIDPEFYLHSMEINSPPLGMKRMVEILRNRTPKLRFGYFNLQKERFG